MTVELETIIQNVKRNPKPILIAASRKRLLSFSRYMQPTMEVEPFHEFYYYVLDLFARGLIKKLIVTMPPQHGKSEGSSRKLPAFVLGLNPDKKVCIASYAATIAQDFNRDVQRIMDSEEYREIFPDTFLNGSGGQTFNNVYVRNTNVIEMVGRKGSLRVVGTGGALTSKSVDMLVMDDLYKDYEEGNSPIVREKTWNWYTSVARSRLDNEGQELMVFTRWNEDDTIGRLEDIETVIEVTRYNQLENIPKGAWIKINFEAIKTGQPTEIDPREPGTSLWENKHNLDGLIEKKKLDKIQFDCLYQGAPNSKEGKLYQEFKTYKTVQEYGITIGKGNYTDTADEGDDMLCSISYDKVRGKGTDGKPFTYILVTDMVYTDEPIEKTTESVPMLLERTGTRYANIESNNGGKSFALMVRKKTPRTKIDWFHQSKNKESRILTNAVLVNNHIIMPFDWETRFPLFYKAVNDFKRKFEANAHDDAPDTLTGIIEKDILSEAAKKGVKRTN